MSEAVTVIAFDLSLTNSGWAVGTFKQGKLEVIEFGSIGTKRYAHISTGKRLHYIAGEVRKLYKRFEIDKVAKERSFSNSRVVASQQIQKVNGVWEMVSHLAEFDEFAEIPPTTVKKQLTDNGRATKKAVADAVKAITGITTNNEDESDAIAVLISYGYMEGLLEREVVAQ